MNTIYKLFISISLLVIVSEWGHAQSANVTEGCVPLEVNFSPPAGQSDFSWKFQDGSAGSTDASPSHQFVNPGVYEVSLNNGVNGSEVGTVTITVFDDIDIQIDVQLIDPCNPRRYQFTNNSVIPDGLTVTGYKWTFGDGSESSLENPINFYTQPGLKSIGLEIFTDIPGCNNSDFFVDIVDVSAEPTLNAFFSATPSASCDIPETVFFINTGDSDGIDFNWDFGDGTSSNSASNTIHEYTEEGIYEATLTLTKGDCVATFERTISVGAPLADFGFNDTLCIFAPTELTNNTAATSFLWTFPESVTVVPGSSVNMTSPVVIFSEEGLVTINMVGQVGGDADCIVDTTFQVYIQDPQVAVTIDPENTCLSPATIEITTTETFANYNWFGENGEMTYTATYEEPTRDSFYINVIDTISIDLVVTTFQGCLDTLDDYYLHQIPEAHFIPSVHHGCAPLSVTFQDTSTSFEPILTYTYDYGNGDTQTFSNGDDHNYTFNDPGEYLVTLVIENEAGCIDTSWAVLIEVGTQVNIEYELDQSEICIGETITINAVNIDENIDAFNLSTDDGRSHHCEGESSLQHTFISNTGVFDIEYTVDYNGCRTVITDQDAITVLGPKADLWYMINCDDPLAVMFADSSQMATSIVWTIEDPSGVDATYTDSDFTHTFPESGDYTVYLEAFNDITGCPSHTDSVVIHARELTAVFDLPENLCDNIFYDLDASMSVDVDNDCWKGYTWSFLQNGRPRRVGVDTLMHIFPVAGEDIVTLTVEDINGCTQAMSDTVNVFSIRPNFEFDKEPICFPAEISFTDTSTSDTTIVKWGYLHGAFGLSNQVEFSNEANNTENFDFFDQNLTELPIFLGIEDALGCVDTIQRNIDVYRPLTEISSDPKPICIEGEVDFIATDITGQGSTLDYIWDFGNGQSSTDSTATIQYLTSGTYPVTLNLTEESTGCQNEQRDTIIVTDPPIAAFSGANEGMTLGPNDLICAPGVIDFTNETIANGNPPLSYIWGAGAGGTSLNTNPTFTFPIGTHEVTLVALSDYGCSDTITASYTLVDVSGDYEILNDVICRGDSITFQLVDTSGVSSWSWDFGLGQVFTDVNPITQVFDNDVQGNETVVSLSLQAAGNACEIVISEPIDFSDPIDIEVPNLFTPNGDEVNDFFRLTNRQIDVAGIIGYLEFRVFNRWGDLVYDNSNGLEGWDGNINGEPAPAEVYGYYIVPELNECAEEIGNVPETFQGDITLMR